MRESRRCEPVSHNTSPKWEKKIRWPVRCDNCNGIDFRGNADCRFPDRWRSRADRGVYFGLRWEAQRNAALLAAFGSPMTSAAIPRNYPAHLIDLLFSREAEQRKRCGAALPVAPQNAAAGRFRVNGKLLRAQRRSRRQPRKQSRCSSRAPDWSTERILCRSRERDRPIGWHSAASLSNCC
jgi:hypothetical protein